jgi:hypothetical protein
VLGAGCHDLICKPLDFGNLRPMIDQYLHCAGKTDGPCRYR